MRLSRRRQNHLLICVALSLIVVVHRFIPTAGPPVTHLVSDPEAPPSEQIGGTTSWRRDEEPTAELRSAPAVRAPPRELSAAGVSERTMQCPTYAGPMYFPYSNPKPVTRRAVRVAALPGALEEQPARRPGLHVESLLPFELSAVRLASDTRFGAAQRTNAAFLRLLDPDRLLFFFRRLANLPQPRTDIVPYGGWESQGSGLRGEFTGHYLHAASAVAAASDDQLLRSRCEMIVRVLAECQATDGYLSAFPQSEFATVEDFKSRYPWVPYYVVHKVLAGLLAVHELLGSNLALRVAERLATHVRGRVSRMLVKGLDTWHDFINQEVGGMSEALADLSRLTGNSTWLQLAALFERPCFVGALARDGGAPEAIERLHANTHLPQILGTMARYEATGEPTLRAAAEAFWRELSGQHTFATGGSTTGEIWLRAGTLGDAVAPQRKDNYWAHDQAETCVAHNSMRVSRRLLQWSPWAAWERPLEHAAYYERTLFNAVLGTQRGAKPGEMLYMMPLGSGVSKAGIPDAPQGHHWSDAENHFWCCQGSGIEAFARLADSIFWRRGGGSGGGGSSQASSEPNHLVVLQLLPSTLLWRELDVRVDVRGDYPGSVPASAPLRVQIQLERSAGASTSGQLELGVRLPAWASSLTLAPLSGALSLAQPSGSALQPGSLLQLRFAPAEGEEASGDLELEIIPAISWEKIKDSRPHFDTLRACLYGPLVLAGFTYAERALPHGATLLPVPPTEQSSLASLRIHVKSDAAKGDGAGCLVRRWGSVWLIHPDRTRNFLPKPPAACLARGTPIEEVLSSFPQAHGGGQGYAFDAAQTAAACATLDGCVLPEGKSAFADGRLFIMHMGASMPVAITAPPPLVTGGPRKGGTDAANAATWRLTPTPVGLDSTPADSDWLYIESFDMPGYVLSPAAGDRAGVVAVTLERAGGNDSAAQRWRKVRPASGGTDDSWLLQNGGKGGGMLSARRRDAKASVGVVPHRGVAVTREWDLVMTPGSDAARDDIKPITVEPPFAEYAPTSFWLTRPPGEAPAAMEADRAAKIRPFLLVPLNELQDEHYTVYFCKPASAKDASKPPRFCV